MKETIISIKVCEADSASELLPAYADLLQQAVAAAHNAYAPYSRFQVGAAVLLENGEVVCGANQENAAYPAGLCAERVALFYANARYPNVPVKAIAISSSCGGQVNDEPVYPCGDCRQALLEAEMRYGKPVHVIMGGAKKIKMVAGPRDLLPLSFELKKS